MLSVCRSFSSSVASPSFRFDSFYPFICFGGGQSLAIVFLSYRCDHDHDNSDEKTITMKVKERGEKMRKRKKPGEKEREKKMTAVSRSRSAIQR